MSERWTTSEEWIGRLRDAVANAGVGGSTEEDAEQRIIDWLARLRNLHGVPFTFLVPDVRMLPQESIRFFRVDENWIDCLIDGAFSIGRSTTGDGERERESRRIERIRVPLRRRAAAARARRVFGASDARANEEPSPVRSGFILRSGVVAGWPSIEVRAYAGGPPRELRAIRLDRPSRDVLFAIFDGDVSTLSLSEPAETLHFGFEPSATATGYRKVLKWVTGSPEHPAGSLIQNATVSVPMRDPARRVADVSALAESIHQALLGRNAIGRNAPYTAAELALELVQGVQEVDFPVEGAPQ